MNAETKNQADDRHQDRPAVDRATAVLLAAALRTHLQLHRQMGIQSYPLTPALHAFLHPKPQRPEQSSGPPRPRRPKPAADQVSQATSTAAATPPAPSDHFPDLYRDIDACRRCALASTRIGQASGQGKVSSPLCVVGDYCRRGGAADASEDCIFGAEEDALLWKMMQAIGMGREDVYVTNVVKCVPQPDAVPTLSCEQSCQGFVQREISLVQPRLILAMGEAAARAVLGVGGSVLRLRGRLHPSRFRDGSGGIVSVMVSLHPRYLLEQPAMKRAAWEDLQIVQRHLRILPEPDAVPRAVT